MTLETITKQEERTSDNEKVEAFKKTDIKSPQDARPVYARTYWISWENYN